MKYAEFVGKICVVIYPTDSWRGGTWLGLLQRFDVVAVCSVNESEVDYVAVILTKYGVREIFMHPHKLAAI